MTNLRSIQIDIVSDVVCPWCVVGYLRLTQALESFTDKVSPHITWHPFELNPDMPMGGQDLTEHLTQKYDISTSQSHENRDHLMEQGKSLGFVFQYRPGMRIYNTFQAHQLLHWASEFGKQTAMQLALFEAYFTHGQALDQISVLQKIAENAGLDPNEAGEILKDHRFAEDVRKQEKHWQRQGIRAVPAFLFDQQFLISGAQDAKVFENVLGHIIGRQS